MKKVNNVLISTLRISLGVFFGFIAIIGILFLIYNIRSFIDKKSEKRVIFEINTETVNGQVCIKERGSWSYFNKHYKLDCCPGLRSIDTATSWSPSHLDENDGICSINLSGPILYCLRCGDGICGANENYCNCIDDCPNKEDDGGRAPLLKLK